MSVPINKEHLAPLKVFVDLCTKNPSILHLPDLKFVKDFVENFGGKIPVGTTDGDFFKGGCPMGNNKNQTDNAEDEEAGSETEDVIDFDMTGVIPPDNDPPQKMGDMSIEPTEDDITASQNKRSEALSAYAEGDLEKSIALYTEAIILNPQAALLYAKRGQVYLKLKKPNACIRDCDRAIEINPDSAAAHKFRGRANQLLGNWEKAATDLRLACQFDFDEQADEWLREVTPNARKIEEHKRKKERRDYEKLEEAKRQANEKAREQAKARGSSSQASDGASKPSMGDFFQYLNDPEVQTAFQDPELSAAFVDITQNPANILKYQKNPKVMQLINKVATKFGGAGGGIPGMGGMGGMPGFFSGAGGPTSKPSAPQPDDDVGLD